MKRRSIVRPLLALPILLGLTACGSGQNRVALAQKTVSDYWSDIGHIKFNSAYALLSPANQHNMTRQDFEQNMFEFLRGTQGVSSQVKQAKVVGDCALVALDLHFPAAAGATLHAYQHLYWLNGGWRITEPDGRVTRQPTKLTSCPTGA